MQKKGKQPQLIRKAVRYLFILAALPFSLGFYYNSASLLEPDKRIYQRRQHDLENFVPVHREHEKKALIHDIPHTLWFTYKHNILETKEPLAFYDNIQNTIEQYRSLWNEANAPAHFLTDEDCVQRIEQLEPRLVPHFHESDGMFKGDICRMVALYQNGGYYFDIDLQVIEPINLDRKNQYYGNGTYISFATAKEAPGIKNDKGFFQAFLASTPHHPIMRRALNNTLDYFEGRYKPRGSLWGVSVIADAHDSMSLHERGSVVLLQEHPLRPKDYPNLRRQNGGSVCNHVVHDPLHKIAYFRSRIMLPKNLSGKCNE